MRLLGYGFAVILAILAYQNGFSRPWIIPFTERGSTSAVWLYKARYVDGPIARVFGYANNMAGCQQLAETLNARFPVAGYYCRE